MQREYPSCPNDYFQTMHRTIIAKFKKSKTPSSQAQAPSCSPGSSTTSALDSAKTIFQLVANLGSGAINVPGLQAAGLIGLQITEIVKTIKNNQEDCVNLVAQISQILEPLYETLGGQSGQDLESRLKNDLERFKGDLTVIKDNLETLSHKKTFRRTLDATSDSGAIVECQGMVDRSIKRFQIYTAIALRMDVAQLGRNVEKMHTPATPNITAGATRVDNAHIGQSITYEANPVPGESTASQKLTPPLTRPSAPEIFFGRDDILSELSHHLLRDQCSKAAILGPGGIGKTSVGLHIIHQPDVVAHYDSRRYFVSCEAITTAESLAVSILQLMNIPISSNENVIETLGRAMLSVPPTLLLLDNFETPWDGKSTRSGVSNVLTTITKLSSISLVITMRGTVPPPPVRWTFKTILSPLDPLAASHLFLAINPMEDISNADQEVLDSLLRDLDYVPLAITLLATVGQGFAPSTLQQMWLEERTALFSLRHSRLESVDVSVGVSLAMLDITDTPEAIQLLGVLCLLPDGLSAWEGRLSSVAPALTNVHHLARLLIHTALVQMDGSLLRVLSPIRHFILKERAADELHVEKLECYFWDLISTHANTPVGTNFKSAQSALNPDLGNITALILYAFETHPSLQVVDAALSMSQFFYNTIPSTHLLEKTKIVLTQIESPLRNARLYQRLGNMLGRQDKFEEGSRALKEAREVFVKIGDRLGAAECSQSLGDILRLQNKYEASSAVLTEARDVFMEIGSPGRLGAARCLAGLGVILMMQAKYETASITLTAARQEFLEIGDRLGAARCLRNLGHIFVLQDKYDAASTAQTEAKEEFFEIGARDGVAQCLLALGEINRVQNNYEAASTAVREARAEFLAIGYRLEALRCSQSLGNILRMEGRYEEASKSVTESRDLFAEIGSRIGVVRCSQILGDILRMQGKYEEAWATLTAARGEFLEMEYRRGATQCLQSLGEILRMQFKYEAASTALKEAKDMFVEMGNRLGVARCSKSLGDILLMQGNSEEASKALTEARDIFLAIGIASHTALT